MNCHVNRAHFFLACDFAIYDLLWGLSHQGSRHLMSQHEGYNIGVSP